MNRKETEAYIGHHIQVAGGQPGIFTEAAVDRIYRDTQGIPRRINNRCRAALLDAYTRDRRVIEEANIQRVLAG
ncbi:MAG: hypothetical protein R6U98_30820 [Pirellulaceae bacterium]